MSLPERWLRDAYLIGPSRRIDSDLDELTAHWREAVAAGQEQWAARSMALRESGVPMADSQWFTSLQRPVMTADQTAVAGVAEGALWAPRYAALPSFFAFAGKKARIRASGVMTTAATPGTLILTPRYGTSTAGTSLGAGVVSGTLAASKTNVPWFFDSMVLCRSEGTAGSLLFYGVWESPQGYTTAPGIVEAGSNAAVTVDTTAATSGIVLGATHSVAGSSSTARQLAIEALN